MLKSSSKYRTFKFDLKESSKNYFRTKLRSRLSKEIMNKECNETIMEIDSDVKPKTKKGVN